ncbi:hypothetical protein L7F22_052600 [Adiantum nelumboides]|nr:hypothetical protein [Adiantum nelumboides]
MANPTLQGEVLQKLQAYGFLPTHQEERAPEKSLRETSKRGLSTVREGENPYQEFCNFLLDDTQHQSRRRGHAQREESPPKENERSRSPVESMEEDVAPQRRRAQRSPTPTKRKISPQSPPHREFKKKEKKFKKKTERKRSPSSPSSSPSSSSDESGGNSLRKSPRRGHRRSHAAWRRSNKVKKFKEGGKSISFLTYDGTFAATDKVLAFIQQFDAVLGDEGFTESSKLRHVAMHFQNSARLWWASTRANGEAPQTWKNLRASIIKLFLSSDAKDKVLTEWQSLKLTPLESIHKKATGKAGGGLVLHDSNGEVVMKKHVKLPDSTSNMKQNTTYYSMDWRLREKVQAIRRLFNQFEEVQLYHIPRKQNEVADLLAQKAVACDESEVQVINAATAIKQPRYQGMESLAPIVSYILEGEFPQSFTKAQKQRLMEKASSYLFLEGVLYQRGKDQVCRRIPTVEEIPSILEGLHEEACGGHFAQELTAKKILLFGYVWPSLHIDVQHWCKSCHNCQVNGNKHLLHGPRQLVLANGPFEKWGIDAMGPLPRTKNEKLYILVAIDYMTRWVEAQSVTRVNEKTVSRFVYTHICCRFGTPLEIVSDNGPGFRKGLLTEVYEELHILHRHSTPYYPQSNGLVEKANGIIAGIIRKMVKNKTKLWDDFLDGALWAYRTTYKEATEFTPFHLVYGQEALQPIELNIPTMRLHGKAAQRKEEKWTYRLLTLAELEWKREEAYECYKRKATQVKDKLDKEVKDKGIKKGDLVLRYDNRLDNRFDAKFETRWQGPYIVKKAFNSSYYQLMDLDGKEHPRKVNGYRLKPYLSRILPKDLQDQRQKSTLSHKSCSLVQSLELMAPSAAKPDLTTIGYDGDTTIADYDPYQLHIKLAMTCSALLHARVNLLGAAIYYGCQLEKLAESCKWLYVAWVQCMVAWEVGRVLVQSLFWP